MKYKGVEEYCYAERILKKYPNVTFDIYGFTSETGLGEISKKDIKKLAKKQELVFKVVLIMSLKKC